MARNGLKWLCRIRDEYDRRVTEDAAIEMICFALLLRGVIICSPVTLRQIFMLIAQRCARFIVSVGLNLDRPSTTNTASRPRE